MAVDYREADGNYDLQGAHQFTLLWGQGLREHHKVLDVGCGSLCLGRLLIPFLRPGLYVGLEPNAALVEAGLKHESGHEITQVKQPVFLSNSDYDASEHGPLDFIIVHSVFTHAGLAEIETALSRLHQVLKPDGVLLATFVLDEEQPGHTGEWVYPLCVSHRRGELLPLARKLGYQAEVMPQLYPVSVAYRRGDTNRALPQTWLRFRQRVEAEQQARWRTSPWEPLAHKPAAPVLENPIRCPDDRLGRPGPNRPETVRALLLRLLRQSRPDRGESSSRSGPDG
ncbi:MAG: class I SAM-dependent methyltransferase [Vulcanimicrobiota bacterium]